MAQTVDRAYELLRNGIFRGTYPVGSRLREAEIAANIDASRSPVREALRRLAEDGLVELVPHRGAIVARWDEGELDAILDIRAMLEGYATRRAAPRIDKPTLDQLDALCDSAESMLRADGPDAMRRIADVNQQFHQLVLSWAGSKRLVSTLSGLSRVPLLMGVLPDVYTEAMRRSLAHHREIAEALRAHDPGWAESIMHAHIKAARAARREDRLSWPFPTP